MAEVTASGNPFAIGDKVKLSNLGHARKLYRLKFDKVGTVMGHGRGHNTNACCFVRWDIREVSHDLIHHIFLRSA